MLETLKLTEILWLFGKGAGLIGFTSLSLLIFSGDTARFFDRFFGLDRIIKFQRKFSLFVAVFLVMHPVFFMLSAQEVLDFLIPDFTILPFAAGVVGFYIFIAIMIASQLYKRISYRAWQYIHIVTYVLFLMALYHARNWGSSAEFTWAKVLYFTLALLVLIGFIYRTQYKLRKLKAGKFIVESVKPETHDTFTVKVRPTKNFDFIAGQFAFLRIENGELHARHPFTISNAPGKDTLNFTIKRAGRFTQAAEKLQKGEELKIDGPFGTFTLDDSARDIVFIAGGVGITPFMSMLESLEGQDPHRNITLLFGCKKQEDIIFADKLSKIKAPWFTQACVLSQEQLNEEGFESGYINRDVLDKYVRNYNETLFYICGPEAMKASVQKYLWTKGVSRKDIIIEDFFW